MGLQTKSPSPNHRFGTPTSQQPKSRPPRPFIVPVFIPHAGCPHQCIFCDQNTITGTRPSIPAPIEVRKHIRRFLEYRQNRSASIQIAFYGGNFLGLAHKRVKSLLQEAAAFIKAGHADSIRFSTRPDTVTEDRMALIKDFPVSTIELGAQSMDDRVLAAANRGHTASDTEKAVRQLKDREYEIGVQMMIGLPQETEAQMLETGRQIAELSPDFVRIYPTIVLARSPLARLYEKKIYRPLSLHAAVATTKKLYLLFKRRQIRVVRMGLQASGDLDEKSTILAGPFHPAFGHLVFSEIFFDKAVSELSGKAKINDRAVLYVNPRSISKVRGIQNAAVLRLKKKFRLKAVNVVPDERLAEDDLTVDVIPADLS